MLRKSLYGSLATLLLATSCSGDAVPPETPSPPADSATTSSTTTPSTTTTAAPPVIEIADAPAEVVQLVRDFYAFATGESAHEPAAIPEVLGSVPLTAAATPSSGVASVGQFLGQGVATVEAGSDLFLLIDDGSGWTIVGGKWPSLQVPATFGGAPRLVLVVGSDARPGEDPTGARADSIHLGALNGAGAGTLVGVPRDSWVGVPGVGNRKITASLAIGGPDKLVETFEAMSGLDVEGYVLTGFVGFQEMLGNVLGGITMFVPRAIRDSASGADFETGDQYLNGPEALALARARKTLPGGDFTRSEHQGLIMIASLRTIRNLGFAAIPRLMEMSEPWLSTDLSPQQLLTLSAMIVETDPDAVTNIVLPGSAGRVGSASVVFVGSSAPSIWQDVADGILDN